MGIQPFIGGAPVLLTGYFALYDASVNGSVLNTGVQCTDGQVITTWNDQSANAYTQTAINNGGSPTFFITTGANLINGHPSVKFSATGYFRSTAVATQNQPVTVYTVLKVTTTTTNFFGDISASPNIYVGGSNGAGAGNGYYLQTANGASFIQGGTNDSTAHTVTWQANGASSLIRVDGTQVASGQVGATGIVGGLNLGTQNNATTGTAGMLLGQWVGYQALHTTAQMQNNEAALKAKWGTP